MGNVKVKDYGLDKILAELAEMKKKSVRVGVMGEKASQDHGELTNIDVAVANEFGSATNPERSFVRSTFDIHKDELKSFAGRFADQVITCKINTNTALEKLGLKTQSLIQKTITEGGIPYIENSPATIKAKGSSHPLIDTGIMRQSITYVVEENNDDN